jgi:hypothetical protein
MKVYIGPTRQHGMEVWVAMMNGEKIGQAMSRAGVVTLARRFLQQQGQLWSESCAR